METTEASEWSPILFITKRYLQAPREICEDDPHNITPDTPGESSLLPIN